MRSFRKLKCPPYLKRNWKIWGRQWKQNIDKQFKWRCDYEDLTRNYLAKSTSDHCAFCDVDNIGYGSASTIEHFRPKKEFFKFAYKYDNLFNCCGECQKKGKRYDKKLLKPDLPTYRFEDYFEIDIATGEINPNRVMPIANQKRAEITIELYNLNKGDRPRFRMKSLRKYLKNQSSGIMPDIDDYSYRFFIDEYNRFMSS